MMISIRMRRISVGLTNKGFHSGEEILIASTCQFRLHAVSWNDTTLKVVSMVRTSPVIRLSEKSILELQSWIKNASLS